MGEGPVGAEGIEVVRDGDGAADVDVVGRGRPLESGHMPFGQAGGLRREEQEGEECGVCHVPEYPATDGLASRRT